MMRFSEHVGMRSFFWRDALRRVRAFLPFDLVERTVPIKLKYNLLTF